jgi:hypothetical protein
VHRTDEAKAITATATTATNRPGGEPRAIRIFSLALCSAALTAGAALLAAGAELPAPGPVLLLALAAALCVNHFVLFPTEHAATAEAAVLFAAVVGFRDDAAFLGPLVVALLVGPLDVLHWEQRSFLRMAYNAGNRGLAALAATAAFAATHELLGGSPAAWCLVVLVAASTLVLVDELLSATLLHLAGEAFTPALRFVFRADVLVLPLAGLGAAAGFLAGALGWWATALVLVPVAFVPELVSAHRRTLTVTAGDVTALCAIVGALAMFALVTPVPTTATLAGLTLIAALAGIELAIDRDTLIPPMIAVVVIVAMVVAAGDQERFAAGLVATVATSVSWFATTRASRGRGLAAALAALAAAAACAELALQLPRTMSGVAVGAATAGFAFAAVAVLVGSDRRRHATAVLWGLPLLAAVLAWAMVWRTLEIVGVSGGGVGFVAALAATFAAAVSWGTPTWRSRLLTHATAHLPLRLLLPVLITTALAATAGAVLGVIARDHALTVGGAWASAGLGDTAAAMAVLGVRQWRFAPRPRMIGLVALLVAAAAFTAAVPALVIHRSWWGPVTTVAAVTAVVAVARRPAAVAGATRPATPSTAEPVRQP